MAPKTQILFDLHHHGIQPETRDIYIHSYFDDDNNNGEPGVEYRQATTFIKNLHFLDRPQYKPIIVHLHSEGGCWANGMAMFNAVQFAQSYITMVAYSQASSMSGILFQSAPLRIMMPDCYFMLHHGYSGGSSVHPFALHTEAEFQLRACKRMLQIFAERAIVGAYFKSKKSSTIESVYNFFDKKIKEKVDWYLDAEESLYYGLTDGILGSKKYPDMSSLKE